MLRSGMEKETTEGAELSEVGSTVLGGEDEVVDRVLARMEDPDLRCEALFFFGARRVADGDRERGTALLERAVAMKRTSIDLYYCAVAALGRIHGDR